MKINLKSNTNLLVFRCLDSATLLGGHHVDHHYNFLKDTCVDFSSAQNLVNQYNKIFLESYKNDYKSLFENSMTGFNENAQNTEIKELFDKFSKLKLKVGISIYDYFNSKLPLIEKYIKELNETGKLKNYESIIDKACNLFPFSSNNLEIDAYIVWSPHLHNVQGSAYPDKNWLFAETNEMRLNSTDKEPIYIILHEYIHLALNILKNLEKVYPTTLDWNLKREGYADTEKSIFDEAVVYCIADLIIANKDADATLRKYSDQKDIYKIRVIKLAIKFKPIIKDFIEDKINKNDSIKLMFKVFKEV